MLGNLGVGWFASSALLPPHTRAYASSHVNPASFNLARTHMRRYSTPQTEGLGAALQVYESCLSGPTQVAGVAAPVPPHADSPAAVLSTRAAEGAVAGGVASDTQYELLLLAAQGASASGPGFVARLLRAAGRGTNPLDAAPSWVLASTLRALGELSECDAAGVCALWATSAVVAPSMMREDTQPQRSRTLNPSSSPTPHLTTPHKQVILSRCCCAWR